MDSIYTIDELNEAKSVIIKALKLLKEKNIKHGVELKIKDNEKVCIFADIHGDIDSLKNAIPKAEQCDYIIFCGDWIDKGKNNLGCLITVLNLFVKNPNKVIVLTGNHEDMGIFSLFYEFIKTFEKIKGFNGLIDLIDLMFQVFRALPLGCYIEFQPSNKKVFCAHGAYPFMFKKRFIKVEDEYENVWPKLGFNVENKQNYDELIYEDNVSYGLNPAQYINKLYENIEKVSAEVVESPKEMYLFHEIVEELNRLKNNDCNVEEAKQKLINNEKNAFYLKGFVAKWNDYNAYVGRCQKAKQAVIDLRAYVMWGDMYVVDMTQQETQKLKELKTEDDWMEYYKQKGSEYLKYERAEVKRFNLCYPEEQLKKWMSDSKINAFIRGHETTSHLYRVRDLKTGHEYFPKQDIDLTTSSMLYICFHSTASYSQYCPKTLSDPKICIIHNGKIGYESVNK